MESHQVALVPPRRLGSLLRQARIAGSVELEDLASRGDFGLIDLEDIEQGRRSIDDATLALLLTLYGIEDAGLLPDRARLVIDLDAGRIAVDQADIMVGDETDADAVLTRYLALVYRLRDLPVGTPVPLRDVDLDILSTALKIESADVGLRLERLMRQETIVRNDQRRLRRRLLVPVAGVVVAATAVGVLVLVSQIGGESGPVGTDTKTTQVTTDLGSGAAVVGNPAADVVTDIGSGGAVEVNPATAAGG